MQKLMPLPTKEREIFMDVLRGFAILGIFIANLNGFSWFNIDTKVSSPFLSPASDKKLLFLQHMFVEGKFYTIFSLLFGWGLALQIKRTQLTGIHGLSTIKRRLFFMLILGGIHILVWSGDIVFFYAILAFILLPFRKLSNKSLLIWGFILILSPIVLYAAKSHWLWLNAPTMLMYDTAEKIDKKLLGNSLGSMDEIAQYLSKANWWEALKANLSGFFYRFGYLFFVSRIPKVLGIFLIGFALGRSGYFYSLLQNRKVLYRMLAAGILIGLPANYFLAYFMMHHSQDFWQLKLNGLYQTIFYALGVVPLSFSYVVILILAYQSFLKKILTSIFAPVGKMAFSNYIFQTLVGSFVFLGAGLGNIQKVGPTYYIPFGFFVFIIQILFSRLWLTYFHYGPIEWLWRSATYKKWQPLRKRTSTAALI